MAFTFVAILVLCAPSLADSRHRFRGALASAELGFPEAALGLFSKSKGSGLAATFAAQGVMAVAKAKCTQEESLDTWKARGEKTESFIKAYQDANPKGIVQVDNGAAGCVDYEQFAEGPKQALQQSQWTQLLTLVHHSPPDICLSDTTTSKMQDFRKLEMSLFPVKGAMAELNSVRGYGVYWPPQDLCKEEACPLVVSLQGLSERAKFPRNPYDFQALENSGLMRVLQKDPSCSGTLRSVVVFPQITKNESWVKDGPRLLEEFVMPLINSVMDRPEGHIDENRIAITGYSEGAFSAMQAAARYPHFFSVAAVISASLPSWQNVEFFSRSSEQAEAEAKSWKLKAVLVAIGENDHSGDMVENLKNILKFTSEAGLHDRVPTNIRLYAGLGHNHWEKVYNNWPALHEIFWHGDYSKLLVKDRHAEVGEAETSFPF